MNIHFIDLCKSYKGKAVFEKISGQISDGDKVGLIGVNGRKDNSCQAFGGSRSRRQWNY